MIWPADCATGIGEAISDFKAALPGWWYSLGECQVSCHASCAPTRESRDLALIPIDEQFDSGFHADIPQPTTLAAALRSVMGEALSARAKAVEHHSTNSLQVVEHCSTGSDSGAR